MFKSNNIHPHTFQKLKGVGVYMDFAASVSPNASSIHDIGVKAKHSLESARLLVSEILKTQKQNIIFTSGGTESNNLAIMGVVFSVNSEFLPHIVTTNIEHASVLETFKNLEKRKIAEITIVQVESNGIVDPRKIKKALKKNTVLVSVMYANNEIGTIQPIAEIAKEIRHHNKQKMKRKVFERSGRDRDPENRGPEKTLPFHVLLHTDAVQAVNYLDLNVEKLGVDMMTLSGSKIENSGKVGVLWKRSNVNLVPIMYGGDQEFGLRPGTENVEEIVKFSKALEQTQKIKEKEGKRLLKIRNYFLAKLPKIDFSSKIIVNGDVVNRLPNNVNITIPKLPSDLLVLELSAKGVMVSSKSACKSGDGKDSHVILAIRQKDGLQSGDFSESGSIRFSFGRSTNKAQVDYVLKSLKDILQKLKKWYY